MSAGCNLGLRSCGCWYRGGTPRQFQRQGFAWFFAILEPDEGLVVMIFVVADNQVAAGAVYITTVNSG